MKRYNDNTAELLPIGTNVLIDVFWSLRSSINPQCTMPAKILDVTETQYYVHPYGQGAQYVFHNCAIEDKNQYFDTMTKEGFRTMSDGQLDWENESDESKLHGTE